MIRLLKYGRYFIVSLLQEERGGEENYVLLYDNIGLGNWGFNEGKPALYVCILVGRRRSNGSLAHALMNMTVVGFPSAAGFLVIPTSRPCTGEIRKQRSQCRSHYPLRHFGCGNRDLD